MCHKAGKYSVLEMESEDSDGTQFAVKESDTSQPAPCPESDADADFVVGGDEEALWYAGLTPRYLVMTRSTGPEGDVVIFDLDQRRVALEAHADDVAVDDEGATYWERVADGTPENCPQFADYKANDFGAKIVAETRFAFSDATSSRTGEKRCDPVQ